MPMYVMAMPIGNAEDISARALRVLKSADLILAEDTVKSSKFLAVHAITSPMRRCDSYAEKEISLDKNLQKLFLEGKSVVFISDAGSPGICDPGREVVCQARDEQVPVIPIPGPCAATAALSVSGFSGNRFSFGGYPPRSSSARREYFNTLKLRGETFVFYEAARRLFACLEDLQEVFGDACKILIAREMTKTYEDFYSGPLQGLSVDARKSMKGEITVVVEGDKKQVNKPLLIRAGEDEKLLQRFLDYMPVSKAAETLADITGGERKLYYKKAVALKEKNK